jgi:hypothetical protein
MVRILIALIACYLAGTAAGRGFLPYGIGVPASNFKHDIDSIAASSLLLKEPTRVKDAATGVALDGFRKAAGSIGAGN